VLNEVKIQSLLKWGNWIIRMDNDGYSYGDFKWESMGKWTRAADWNPRPVCGGGLHGQNQEFNGFCRAGKRLVLCEIGRKKVGIDKEKLKVKSAKIIAVNDKIPFIFLSFISLSLEGYQHKLPEGLTSVGGDLYLGGYQHKLPEGLTNVGGYLHLGSYQHKLPEGLTNVGGYLSLGGYQHKLPEGLTNVGGYLYL
jgi:hypothetical protein